MKTFAFFVPQEKIGAVIFTDGPDVGHDIIDKVLATIDPDRPLYDATLWQKFPAHEGKNFKISASDLQHFGRIVAKQEVSLASENVRFW